MRGNFGYRQLNVIYLFHFGAHQNLSDMRTWSHQYDQSRFHCYGKDGSRSNPYLFEPKKGIFYNNWSWCRNMIRQFAVVD